MNNIKNRLVLAVISLLILSMPGIQIKAVTTTNQIPRVKFIETGDRVSFAIDINNDLWAWGSNLSEQIGNGSDRYIPVKIPVKILSGISSVSGSAYSALAVGSNGSLWAWGDSTWGQIGIDTITYSEFPIKVIDNVDSVSSGFRNSAVVKMDGSLWVWGWNPWGQIGNNTTTDSAIPIKVMESVNLVSFGSVTTFATMTNGSLWAWGSNDLAQFGNNTTISSLIPVKVMDDVSSFSAGGSHTFAIQKDGSLWGWGRNVNGVIGNGNGNDSLVLVPIKVLDNVLSVSTGSSHALAIKTDGSLWAWGNNAYGQLGNETNVSSAIPVKVMDNVISVSAGDMHTIAIKSDGSLWAWGRNDYGQLGNGTTISSNIPIQITVGTSVQTPTGLIVVSSSYNSIKLAWSVVSGAQGYEVYRSSTLTGSYDLVNTVVSNGVLDVGLTTGKAYYYKVKAFTVNGTNKIYSSDSAIVSSKPILNAPLQVQAVPQSPFSIKTTWLAVQGASGYEIYRSLTSGGPFAYIGVSGLNTYLDASGLIAGRTYYYRVKAFRTIGTIRAYSKESTIAYTTTALNAPRWVLSAAEQNLIVKTTWAAVTYAMGYDVYRSATMYGTYALIGTTTSTSYRDAGLKQGQTYYYKVKAYRIVNGSKVSSGFSPLGSALAINDYEYAVFPMAVLRVTQGPYKTYLPHSHITTNAMDFGGTIGSSKDNVFAPFTGIVRWKSEKYGAVWLESKNPVRWADGTIDYMTVLFLHDNDISDLQVGMEIPQYKVFYQEGTQSPDKIDEHLHMECMRGRTINGGYAGYGNIYAYDAFFIKNTTSVNPAGGFTWKPLP